MALDNMAYESVMWFYVAQDGHVAGCYEIGFSKSVKLFG
jgi:hypothetical protein